MDIKTSFPDEAALSNHIRSNTTTFVNKLRATVGPAEEEYKISLKNYRRGSAKIGGAVFTFFAAIYIMDAFAELGIELDPIVIISILVFTIGGSIYFGVKGWKQIKGTREVIYKFNKTLNKEIFPSVFGLFSVNAQVIEQNLAIKDKEKVDLAKKASIWTRNSSLLASKIKNEQYTDVINLLDHSELITEPRNTVTVDDIVTGTYKNKTFFLSELDVKHVTGSGKNRKVKKIFKGYFVSLDLDVQLNGKTFVSTEGDKKGFGHQSFWKNIKKSHGRVEVTELEWNDFENLLHVAASDPTEARYVLSPDFMQDLYSWWLDKKVNIRVAFMGDRMYLLFPDKRIKFSDTVNDLSGAEVVKYMESIALPLLHVMHLAEDASKQFNKT